MEVSQRKEMTAHGKLTSSSSATAPRPEESWLGCGGPDNAAENDSRRLQSKLDVENASDNRLEYTV